MTKTPIFKGSCTAMISPFNDNGIDFDRLEKNIDFQYEAGTSAILICGTTGENATMNAGEYEEIVRRAVLHNKSRMKLIVGVGGNNTQAVVKKAEYAKYTGADAILMVTPYYNKTSQKGLVEHFTYVADRVNLPMILYNVPSRTGIGISAETYKLLSQHPNINGVKEASGDISLAANVRGICGDELNIWSGNDSDTVPLMSLGAQGVISVASNIIPAAVAKLCDLCLNSDFTAATELYCKYAPLFATLFIETNPIPLKTAMKLMDMDSGVMRLPLTDMSENNLAKLRSVLRDCGLNP